MTHLFWGMLRGLGVTGLVVVGLVAAGPGQAAEIPRYVQGPASGLIFECSQAGQRAPRLDTLVSVVADLDGDGQPDHLIDAGKGCAAVRALYCNPVGCSINVYLSSQSGYGGGAKGWRATVDRATRPAQLVLTTGGSECGKSDDQECSVTLRWNGTEMARVR